MHGPRKGQKRKKMTEKEKGNKERLEIALLSLHYILCHI
jgi:hypothetical protein